MVKFTAPLDLNIAEYTFTASVDLNIIELKFAEFDILT